MTVDEDSWTTGIAFMICSSQVEELYDKKEKKNMCIHAI